MGAITCVDLNPPVIDIIGINRREDWTDDVERLFAKEFI